MPESSVESRWITSLPVAQLCVGSRALRGRQSLDPQIRPALRQLGIHLRFRQLGYSGRKLARFAVAGPRRRRMREHAKNAAKQSASVRRRYLPVLAITCPVTLTSAEQICSPLRMPIQMHNASYLSEAGALPKDAGIYLALGLSQAGSREAGIRGAEPACRRNSVEGTPAGGFGRVG